MKIITSAIVGLITLWDFSTIAKANPINCMTCIPKKGHYRRLRMRLHNACAAKVRVTGVIYFYSAPGKSAARARYVPDRHLTIWSGSSRTVNAVAPTKIVNKHIVCYVLGKYQ